MPDQTRDTLKKLSVALRKAGGLGDAPIAPPKPGAPPMQPQTQPAAPPAPAAPGGASTTQGALDPQNSKGDRRYDFLLQGCEGRPRLHQVPAIAGRVLVHGPAHQQTALGIRIVIARVDPDQVESRHA